MLTRRARQRGLTMIEILVTIAIIGIMTAIGLPNLSHWLQNVQVKSTAESVLTGIQLTRAEAVRQNVRAQFKLTSTAGLGSWAITTDSLTLPGTFPNAVQSAGAEAGGKNARLGVSKAAVAATGCCTTAIAAGTGMGTTPLPGIVFNAFGQVVTDATVTKITRIDVTNAAYASARRLVITVSSSGMAKLCDPSLPASNSRGCP
ncbi:MAG: GspH/FimT family pseudopilin [Gallionella sp.]